MLSGQIPIVANGDVVPNGCHILEELQVDLFGHLDVFVRVMAKEMSMFQDETEPHNVAPTDTWLLECISAEGLPTSAFESLPRVLAFVFDHM